jgi:hypothetical protein
MQTDTTSSERRAATRYGLECPVEFEQGRGWTRDLSTTGLYFVTGCMLRLRDTLMLVVRMAHSPSLRCRGEIVRIDSQVNGYGVAVRFVDVSFEAMVGAAA